MGNKEEVILLDFWASPYGMRAKIALAEKGVRYQLRDEDLHNKSELLLNMNPVHKVIPVLIHNNKPVCESLNVVEYIDQVWNHNTTPSLLPQDPFLRAQARFWAHFIDKKVCDASRRVILTKKGIDQEGAKEEFLNHLKVLEQELENKPYFGGDTFGYVDVSLIPLFNWFYAIEKSGNFNIRELYPNIKEWEKRCLQRESVVNALADENKIYEYLFNLKKRIGIE